MEAHRVVLLFLALVLLRRGKTILPRVTSSGRNNGMQTLLLQTTASGLSSRYAA